MQRHINQARKGSCERLTTGSNTGVVRCLLHACSDRGPARAQAPMQIKAAAALMHPAQQRYVARITARAAHNPAGE